MLWQTLWQLGAIRLEEPFGEGIRRPGAESRWSTGKDLSWVPVDLGVVLEISYDQLTGSRCHAIRFERWRPDKNAD